MSNITSFARLGLGDVWMILELGFRRFDFPDKIIVKNLQNFVNKNKGKKNEQQEEAKLETLLQRQNRASLELL